MQCNIALDVRWSYCSAIVLQEDLHCTVTGGGGYSGDGGGLVVLVCQMEKKSARRKVNTRKLFHLLQKLLSVKLDNDYCAQEGRKVHNNHEKESAMTQRWSKSYFSKEIFLFSA